MQTVARARISAPPRRLPPVEAQTRAFLARRHRQPAFPFHWHYHAEVELVWVRHGRGLRYVGRSVEAFRAGDLVLVGAKVPHAWGWAPAPGGPADWTVIQLLPERWGEAFWQLPEAKGLRKLLAEADRGLQFVGRPVWRIGGLTEKLAAQRPYSFGAFALFIEICRQLLAVAARPLNAGPVMLESGKCDPRLEAVLKFIDEHSMELTRQSEIAARVKMGPAVFCRWFRRHLGRNFQHYLNELRVARVCARLAAEEQNITTIALECGFNNLANFNRRFREITGLTPRQFRAETREIAAPGRRV